MNLGTLLGMHRIVFTMKNNDNRKKSNSNNNNNNNDENVPIRTIYIAPIKQRIRNKIKPYFERFGAVESVRFHSRTTFARNTFHYGFVQFETCDAAKKALSKSPHRIEEWMVNARAADLWHQPDYHLNAVPINPLLTPPDQESSSNILKALDDDCLREIFKYLSLIDLSNAAEVCVRFNQQAQETFSTKFKGSVCFDNEFTNVKAVEAVLRNFAPKIEELGFAPNVSNSKWFDLVDNYEMPQLKDLACSKCFIDGSSKKSGTFAKLERLSLNRCGVTNLKDLLAKCKELKVLQFWGTDWNEKCLNQRFLKLEEVRITQSPSLTDDELNTFVSMNPKLKKLGLKHNGETRSARIVRVIAHHLHGLETLEIDEDFSKMGDFHTIVQALGRLKSLKHLRFNFNSMSITPLVKALAENRVAIEALFIKFGDAETEDIKYLAQLKQLDTIQMENIDGLDDEDIIHLAKELPQLQQLTLDGSSANEISVIAVKDVVRYASNLSRLTLKSAYNLSIGLDDYKVMLKAIQNRPTKVKLMFEVTGHGDIVDVPDEMLAKNLDCLQVEEGVEDDPAEILGLMMLQGLQRRLFPQLFDEDSDEEFDEYDEWYDEDDDDEDEDEDDDDDIGDNNIFDLD